MICSRRHAGLRRHRRAAFTLVEAMVSIAILAGLVLMLAAMFHQSSRLSREARGGAAAFQAARQVFETIGRDLAGVTRDGFLFLRTQELEYSSKNPNSGLILYYDEEGTPVRMNKGRMDMMVMVTSGNHTSAVDAARSANLARVIWAQTERASGNNLSAAQTERKFWGLNYVLARHQTLMMPDGQSPDLGNGAYGGSNRGPDYYNMSMSDLTRLFGPAMGIGGEQGLPNVTENFGLFSGNGGVLKHELAPYRLASKVLRVGRDGLGLRGEPPGGEGGGDLTRYQVDIEKQIPADFFTTWNYNGTIQSQYNRDEVIRGHERPKIFGPEDYHRIAAFGVAAFQVDWSDGRRKVVTDGNGNSAPQDIDFYPETGFGATLSLSLMGPGELRMYCWNGLSPTSIRDTALRKAFGGVTYETRYQDWNSDLPGNWREITHYTQNMFNGECSNGGGALGRIGWPWPRAIRVRMILFDTASDPPVGYRFEQVFHLLTQ
jgi:type II secretory pathway pseudopilin PulG